ncbi:sensor histidine kinase [Marmoricola sp. RAF53]|uniref:sensor histidine kinase n=1 Tax=Marmoricola sp. RAF53 TaxID=3233059 RepID=UPI003F962327
MDLADVRAIPLFDGLTDEQVGQLLELGEPVEIVPGAELFHEGEHADFWWVLVDGKVELVRHVGNEDVVVGAMDQPGRWAGGFQAWDAQGVYLATGRGALPGRLLRLPAEALRDRFTAWFPFGVHLVQGLYGTARSIEATARQRDALVTLGTLAAGLAHEINNPAAAATRAVGEITGVYDQVLTALRGMAEEGLTAAEFHALDELRRYLDGARAPGDPLALAEAEDAVGTWLEDHDVPGAWDLGAELAAGGADVAWCERVAAAVREEALAPAISWVSATTAMSALLAEVKEATRRVSELVASVRSYSQTGRASRQLVDVTEGIESSLVMLGHKLRDGVEITRAYADPLPRVDAYPGELNQLWTNLIDNAVDAMDGEGSLRICTRHVDGAVVVEFTDTGPGMPPEVAARAFEAFFTTKDVGKGTGLGLDIARRIVVERHHGTIDIDSSPQGTTMRVTLPVA